MNLTISCQPFLRTAVCVARLVAILTLMLEEWLGAVASAPARG